MLKIKKIVIQNYKNIALQELEFSPNINCISGSNGEGKTNLLDAINYLSMTKSFITSLDKYNFRYNEDQFSISANYLMSNGQDCRFSVSVSKKGDKKLKKEDKLYSRISEHIGILPIVVISPLDVSLISDSGEERRKFLNSFLSQIDKEYLDVLLKYNRVLSQRNQYLKSNINIDDDLLLSFDTKLSYFADIIYNKRKDLIKELIPLFKKYYALLSSEKEEVDILYKSDLEHNKLDELLLENRQKDKVLKFTTKGIHRDEVLFIMNEHLIRRTGSQGQQKSFLVSIKFAQYELMKKYFSYEPILLLDDVFDKLDMSRISNLISMVAGDDFGQIFITDSNKVRMSKIVDNITKDRKYFEVTQGVFIEQE